MKTRIILFTLVFHSYICSAQVGKDQFVEMIGQPVFFEKTQELLQLLSDSELNESYQPASLTYTMESFAHGIALDFNQNFILKEIRFYDSGYLYKSCDFDLPSNLKLKMHQELFTERFGNYTVDPSNPYLYHGDFVNGKIEVYFKSKHSELIVFKGRESYIQTQDRQNLANWGYRLIPDGQCQDSSCYEGEHGMAWENNRLLFFGNFSHGIPHGEGFFKDSAGIEFSGNFKLGFIWGEGELSIPGDLKYSGNFIMGKKNGQGTAQFSNGSSYVGKWLNDRMNGKGTFRFSERFFYTGEMKDDQITGEGSLFTPEGRIQGTFKAGRPHGYASQYVNSSQTMIEGNWLNGKKEGKFKLTSPMYGIQELYFKDDVEVETPNN